MKKFIGSDEKKDTYITKVKMIERKKLFQSISGFSSSHDYSL